MSNETFGWRQWRKEKISKPILHKLKSVLPPISDTERQALEAGETWWDAELLSGKPDWDTLVNFGIGEFTEEEQAFIDGPVNELCSMIDDWAITFEHRDIPEELWQFLREKRFFGMIIPKEYGGLGFSAYAHSEIVMRIATCSTSVAVTVMVPNSLGPGELLMEFGTDEQKDYYLPRLADGRELPAFGLTSPEAGSDAAAMLDRGEVCYGQYKGEKVLGMRLNWHKRYITLGPVCSILGLAFKLYDPEHLLGDKEELGITVALVPTDTNGVKIGDRHYPSMQAFQNGPNWGEDVFLPLDAIIGGQEKIGQGWEMLMTALAAGRSISLPSLSTGAAKLAAKSTGAYARIRQQFGIPIGKFEGVQQRLGQIASGAYLLDAARQTTTLALDRGKIPAVISAILKAHATYRMRDIVNDAMDVHGGKTICDGPNNYLGNAYRAVPVAITVEGANILTRNLIIFGQGAMRCHPYLLEEIKAAENPDGEGVLEKFDATLFKHIAFQLKSFGRAWWHSWTGGWFASAPEGAGRNRRHYRQLSRNSARLTFVSEVALVVLGGALKRKEYLSARLGDILSELYLLSCVLKRHQDDGRPKDDNCLVDWCMQDGLHRIEQRFDEFLTNFPVRPLAWLMRFFVLPLGTRQGLPSDKLTTQCAELILDNGEARARLTQGVVVPKASTGVGQVEEAFEQVLATTSLRERMKEANVESIDAALTQNLLTDIEARRLRACDEAVSRAIAVDAFSAEALSSVQHRPVECKATQAK